MEIKAEVEKLLKTGFIYSVPLIEWVSNILLVTNKQGPIGVCFDYRDLNKAFLRIIIQPHSLIRLSMSVSIVKSSHLWMISPTTIKSRSNWNINIRLPLFILRVTFLIVNFHLVLKMLETPSTGPCNTCFMT